jgi:hypothetical protein
MQTIKEFTMADEKMTLDEKIEAIFTYHAPDDQQKIQYEAIRAKAKEMAVTIYANSPVCADQSAAIRLLRQAVQMANAAIALKGLV